MAYTLLLVDDDPLFREELRECLSPDYRVQEASTADEALAQLNKPNDIDLIILDEVMPGSRGTEILSKIKQVAPKVVVIIATGYSSKDVAVQALRERADDFIEKPLDIEKTLLLIARHVRRANGSEGTGSGTRDKINRVQKFLDRNYDKKVRLEDAAQAVALSPKYLSRIFEEYTGVGFNAYKLRVKMNKAKDMLRERGNSVDQISYGLGYENTESFIRMFRKFNGTTPAAYRKQCRDKHIKKNKRS